jgi:hypothetical protein
MADHRVPQLGAEIVDMLKDYDAIIAIVPNDKPRDGSAAPYVDTGRILNDTQIVQVDPAAVG